MKPLIFDYQIKRLESPLDPNYTYDRQLAMNVVTLNGKSVPFIEVDKIKAELMTKTKSDGRESDDDNYNLLELESKTFVGREQDDPDPFKHELTTKTLVNREADDQRENGLLELTTKTRAQRESDDEYFANNE
ncbi:MAG: hypothetical protein EOP45_06285 [Sphingobacteriaceae bacterium]|nr:MAG: hypothetical protein EOP45_06285 [Sphingobacteriaceae bacterium]